MNLIKTCSGFVEVIGAQFGEESCISGFAEVRLERIQGPFGALNQGGQLLAPLKPIIELCGRTVIFIWMNLGMWYGFLELLRSVWIAFIFSGVVEVHRSYFLELLRSIGADNQSAETANQSTDTAEAANHSTESRDRSPAPASQTSESRQTHLPVERQCRSRGWQESRRDRVGL